MINIYQKYLSLLAELECYNQEKIPLCAAETYVSPFVKNALKSDFEGKYCMQNKNYEEIKDFVGSGYIHRLYELLEDECKNVFDCSYADARTLSGMNCISIAINAFIPRGKRILLTTPRQGGHPSVPLLLDLAQIKYDEIPYDYSNFDIDYPILNDLLKSDEYYAVIFAQSDIISPADISKINANSKLIIYDATQTLGMIATGVHRNPLNDHDNLALIGGTHKTLPGPTSGLVLLKNKDLINKIDNLISPSFLRNTQPNNIAGVLLALLEQEQFGYEYQTKVIANSNYLGKKLEELGFQLAKTRDHNYTNTHQLFLLTDKFQMGNIVKHGHKFGITLNKKEKDVFRGAGIRLGLQEITRYGWSDSELDLVARLIHEISFEQPNISLINEIKAVLTSKKVNAYCFDDGIIK